MYLYTYVCILLFHYHKNPKFSDIWMCAEILTKRFFHIVLCPKGEDGMTKSVDPDQTAHRGAEQSDLGLHCLPRPVCLSENLGSLWYFVIFRCFSLM